MIPTMKISEISRILINLRKQYLKNNSINGEDLIRATAIYDVRKKLELRRRSRKI